MIGRIFDIAHASLVDGPGIRTAVFFKGCNLKCAWCHNPERQSFSPQLMYYKDLCTNCGACHCTEISCKLCGKCTLRCPSGAKKLAGYPIEAETVMEEILSDLPFYRDDGGVTFTGGECMLQKDFLLTCLQLCKEKGIHTAVDTAGNVSWENFENILPYTDLFLYDVKVMDDRLHRLYTGASNDLILSNLGALLDSEATVWLRIPVIPSVNDTKENFLALRRFLEKHRRPEKIELLPYHAMGENKYVALGMTCTTFTPPAKEHLQELERYLKE